MKKKIVILLGVVFALVLSFALTACGKVALKLTFKVDGEVYQTISTSGNEVISMPENPTKDGFIFDGWFWDEGTWQKPFTANSLLDTPLSSDMSVYAKFSVDATPTGTEIKAEGFEKNDSVYYTKVSNTTETFSFIGKIRVADGAIWRVFTDVACTAEVPSRTKEVSVGDNKFYILVTNGNDVNSYPFVVRRRPIHTVTYRTNNGSYITSQRVEEDSYATDFTPTRAGYTFKAWNYDFTQPIVGDTTITASFDVVTYNIEYDLAGGEFEGEHVKTYTVETPTFALATPVKRGYTFLGWYDGDKKVEIITRNSIGDRSFTAKWGATPYSITYNLGGGTNATNNPTTYTVEQTITLSDASRDGYRFVGWKEGNVIEKGNVGAKTFTAQWEVVTYSIFYNLDGGEFGGEYHQSYDIATDTFSLVAPVKRGYTFLGWYDGETKVVQIEKGNFGEKRFTAKWETTLYNITYNLGSGTNSTNNPLTYTFEEKVNFFDPYYINGDFIEWQDENGNKITKIEKGSIGDVSITAVYDLYDVKLRLNNDDTFTVVGKQTEGNTVNIKSEYKGKKVTSIGSSAFSGCSGLTSITIPDSVMSIGGHAFDGCPIVIATMPTAAISSIPKTKLKTVIITAGESIGDSAFSGCYRLTSVTIGNSVTSIGGHAFDGCPIETATIPTTAISSIPKIKLKTVIITTGESIGSDAFDGCYSLTSVTIPDSVTSIGDSAFMYCYSLTSVTIPNSVTSIGDSAFNGCSSLTSVTIPDNVTSIGDSAFSGCSNLTSITIGNSVTNIGYGAFYGCSSLTSVTIPNSVTSIGVRAFYYCYRLVEVYNLSTLNIEIGTVNNGHAGYYAIDVYTDINTSSKLYKEGDYIIHTADNGARMLIGYFGTETNITIPDSVTSIGAYAFSGCSSLTNTTIPNSVTSIGNYAFYNCSSLTSITIPDSVTSIGAYAFSGCSSLTNITIPNSVMSIGIYVFDNCRSLTNVKISDGVMSIGWGMFFNCSSLTSITIGNSVTNIGYRAFHDCSSLTSVTIPDSVTIINASAFGGCSRLTSVYYKGSAEEWVKIDGVESDDTYLQSATKYFYSETEPTDDGNYWRYVGGVPTVWAK